MAVTNCVECGASVWDDRECTICGDPLCQYCDDDHIEDCHIEMQIDDEDRKTVV